MGRKWGGEEGTFGKVGVVSRSRTKGWLGLGNLAERNVALVGKWL